MVYDLLRKLISDGKLEDCSITIAHISSEDRKRTILGRDVESIRHDGVEYKGGETGQEVFSVPLKSIIGIELDGKVLYRKKKNIEKIYPRA